MVRSVFVGNVASIVDGVSLLDHTKQKIVSVSDSVELVSHTVSFLDR